MIYIEFIDKNNMDNSEWVYAWVFRPDTKCFIRTSDLFQSADLTAEEVQQQQEIKDEYYSRRAKWLNTKNQVI